MVVVDVDSHWEVAKFERGKHPFEQWRDRFPKIVQHLANGLSGDLLRALPEERRPDGATLLAPLVRASDERHERVTMQPPHPSSPSERQAWMDEVGIDHCLVNPGSWWQLLEYLGPDRPKGAAICNDWLAEQIAEGGHRLHGVAVVDFTDLEAAVAEMTRARAKGHRAFFLYTLDGRPPRATPPGHPEWDVIWSAATDLGMVAVIHVGNTYADYGGWADIGWDLPGGAGVAALLRLSSTKRHHVAEDLLSSLLFGGAFHRHPNLTVVLEEMGVTWIPAYVDFCSRQGRSSTMIGDWPFDLTAGELLRRNVKFTPLPGFSESKALDVVATLPEMALFSSDYPHQEGNADPINVYGEGLQSLDPVTLERFMGGNAFEAYARMSDPL